MQSARPFQSVDLRGDPLRRSLPSVRCRPNFSSGSGATRDPLIFGILPLQRRSDPCNIAPSLEPSQRLQQLSILLDETRATIMNNVTPHCQVSKFKHQHCDLPRLASLPLSLLCDLGFPPKPSCASPSKQSSSEVITFQVDAACRLVN
jgi:hypothetical protein